MLSTKADARTNRKEPNKLNAQEVDRFLAAARAVCSPDRYAAVLMLFTTTLRPGALVALRMDDLDLETMEVVSSRRLSVGEGVGFIVQNLM
jgi:integrase